MLIGLLELVRGRILVNCNLEEIISKAVMCKLLSEVYFSWRVLGSEDHPGNY